MLNILDNQSHLPYNFIIFQTIKKMTAGLKGSNLFWQNFRIF